MKLILEYIGRYKRPFMVAVFFLTIETVADLLQPTFMSYIVDKGVEQNDVGQILRYGAIMLAIAAMGALGAVMRNIYASKTSQQIGRELRGDIYKKVMGLSFENIDRLAPASIITRITNDVTQIQNFINGSMRIMLKAPITCIGAITLIILQTPQQISTMIVILCISFALIGVNMLLGYPRFGKLQRCLDKLNTVSREFLSSIRVVKAFGGQEQEKEKFDSAAGDFAQAGVSAMRVSAIFIPLINLTVNMGIVVLLWLSQNQESGEIGRLMASVNYMTQVLFSLGMVSRILNTAVRATASASRVKEIFDETPVQQNGTEAAEGSTEAAEIRFEEVTFSYANASRPAIENISFTARPGETVGIIGPTGCGKSSLVQLVPRFYDAEQGSIYVDGLEVKDWDMNALRQRVGVAPQKPTLFTGSILQNLRWGNEHASMDEIQAAAEIACVDEFVSNLAEGYETRLGQNGVNLSGGQKQRVSLARALMKKPSILILDDCTSALDATTEAKVLKGLRENLGNMTVLLISQRISTVMRADKILCIEDGKVQGFGTHQDLMETCGTYQAIYDSQIGGARIG